jgi:Transposase zinc-ribbon domain
MAGALDQLSHRTPWWGRRSNHLSHLFFPFYVRVVPCSYRVVPDSFLGERDEISEAMAQSFSWFEKTFRSEEACAAYLQKRCWPDGFACPVCNGRRRAMLKSRAYTYECLDCRRQTSVTTGTVMHRTKLPLTLWLGAAHLIATHPGSTSVRLFEGLFEIPYTTAWLLTKKLRQAMYGEPLDGLVEVSYQKLTSNPGDASLVASRSEKIIVAAAMASLEIRLAAIQGDTQHSIERFVRANVKLEATLVTDTGLQLPDYPQDLRHFEETPPRLPTAFRLLQSYLQQHREPVEVSLKGFAVYHNDTFCQVSGLQAQPTPSR